MKDNTEIVTTDGMAIDTSRHRYPYCVVWTPIPFISWLIPVIGHLGISTSSGVVRDFAGPYYVSQDDMAFGWPTKYWQLRPHLVANGLSYDDAVKEASDEYMNRMHSLCCDNCHSHVSMALNSMKYNSRSDYNMFKTFLLFTIHSKYISFWSFLKSWLPFLVLVTLIVILCIFL